MAVRIGKSRPRRGVFIGLILAAALALCVVIMVVAKLQERTQADVWRENWGFNTPEPERLERIIAYSGRDHAQYVIARYSEDAMRKMLAGPGWVRIGSSSRDIGSLMEAFIAELQLLHPEDREKIAQQFIRHQPVFDERGYYVFMNEEDGDFLIAVLNPELRTLYVLESRQ